MKSFYHSTCPLYPPVHTQYYFYTSTSIHLHTRTYTPPPLLPLHLTPIAPTPATVSNADPALAVAENEGALLQSSLNAFVLLVDPEGVVSTASSDIARHLGLREVSRWGYET